MKAVIQRVLSASVEVSGKTVGKCGKGYLVLLGVENGDGEEDAELWQGKPLCFVCSATKAVK